GGNVEIGGQQRAEFQANSGRNIIQAAAPGGESGTITLTSPDTSSVASMAAVTGSLAAVKDTSNACRAGMQKRGRLYKRGRGGIRPGELDSTLSGGKPPVTSQRSTARIPITGTNNSMQITYTGDCSL
ncbi:hypothetical protein TI03_05330, partial [Achromatium sp. WMS1]